jgi:squalene cyclase
MAGGPRNSVRATLLGCLGCLLLTTHVEAQTRPAPGRRVSAPRVPKRRSPLDLGNLWSKTADTSVEAGLRWLADTQQPGGYWFGDVGHKQGDGYLVFRHAANQKARSEGHIGITAIAGMAFLSGGHLPHRGKYGEAVAKTVDYVLQHVAESGFISDSGTRMYSHAFATLFLAEVYGMSRNRNIKKGLEKAVHIIVDCQNAHGAWRYNAFTQKADLSVTVCQLQALRAARNIGIQVPRGTIDKAVAYIRASQTRAGSNAGLFYYKIHGRGAWRKNTHFAINAAGVTALTSAGVYDLDLIGPAVSFLMEEWEQVRDWYPHHYYFWYGNYYACQALFHAEGLVRERCFRDYYAAMRDHLVADQKSDGRWANDVGPGDVFGTAVACIVLQVPKQYLPIFQR